ncbi:MAG: hypothetical protein ACOCVM_05780 [Desulfovibrionaceae bacterium]
MNVPVLLLVFFTLVEVVLLGVVILFFIRLKKSQAIIDQMQANQERLLKKLQFNAQLEHEIVETFEKRQRELLQLDQKLESRRDDLAGLLKQAAELTNSPQFLRQIILAGNREGKSPKALAKATGLSLEEVKLILDQALR